MQQFRGQKHSNHSRAFTIVELVIVIVVIGILATIVTVGYSGMQKQSLNAHKMDALAKWRDQFQLYSAKNGGRYPLPSQSAREFCLGHNFKYDACWNVYDVYGDSGVVGSGPKPWEPVAYENDQLLNQLETVGELPSPSYCIVQWYCPDGDMDGTGPMVSYRNGVPSIVWDFFFGSSCPGDLTPRWTDGNAAVCALAVATPGEIETTNLLTNPSVETNISNWSVGEWGSGGNGVVTNEQSGGASGQRFYRMRWTSSSTGRNAYGVVLSGAPVSPGESYTCSGSSRSSLAPGAQGHVTIVWAGSGGVWVGQAAGATSPLGGSWVRRGVAGVAPTGTLTAYCVFRIATPTAIPAGTTFDIDAAMLVQSSELPNYADGSSTGDGWSWTGTSNGSTSKGPFL